MPPKHPLSLSAVAKQTSGQGSSNLCYLSRYSLGKLMGPNTHLLVHMVHIDLAFFSTDMIKRSSHQQKIRGSIHVNIHRAQLRAKVGPHLQPRRNSGLLRMGTPPFHPHQS